MSFRSIAEMFLLLLMTSSTCSQSDVSNMLMIIVDDLRPEIGRYLGTDNALNPDIRTPNIDALADSGVVFTNAHTVVSTVSNRCISVSVHTFLCK